MVCTPVAAVSVGAWHSGTRAYLLLQPGQVGGRVHELRAGDRSHGLRLGRTTARVLAVPLGSGSVFATSSQGLPNVLGALVGDGPEQQLKQDFNGYTRLHQEEP